MCEKLLTREVKAVIIDVSKGKNTLKGVVPMKINNLPNNYNHYEWIVARMVEGAAWYYGTWHDRDKANEVALEVDGYVIASSMARPA